MANLKCYRGLCLGDLGVDQSSSTSVEVKNVWPCTLATLVCLHGMDTFQLELGFGPDRMRKNSERPVFNVACALT